jgi:carboxymethylenebutenolidase
MKPTLLSIAAVLIASFAFAVDIPPGEPGSKAAIEKSTRHGEWQDIEVPGAKSPLHTYIVYPEIKDKAPIVLVIHDIYGMGDWPRAVTDQLAADGFIGICPDMLSARGGSAAQGGNDNARGAIGSLKANDVLKYLDAAREYGLKLPSANGKSAVIGFCWGGGHSFSYAAHQPGLNAAVVYYGNPVKEDAMEKIKCPVLGCYGQMDNRITSTVEPTKAAMQKVGKSYDPHVFPGAMHGFLRNQANPANLKAAQEAWPLTIAFLKQNTK